MNSTFYRSSSNRGRLQSIKLDLLGSEASDPDIDYYTLFTNLFFRPKKFNNTCYINYAKLER